MAQWLQVEATRHQVAIAGQVTDKQTGRAIEGSRVTITAGPAAYTHWLDLRLLADPSERPDVTRTAADGHFHYLDLPDGQYTLVASLPGTGSRYGTAPAQVTITRDAEGNIARAAADLSLPPTTIKGQVADSVSGEAVVMAQLRVKASGEQAFANAQGHYLLAGVEAGSRTLLVSAKGYQPASQTVTLDAAGAERTVNFTLIRSTP